MKAIDRKVWIALASVLVLSGCGQMTVMASTSVLPELVPWAKAGAAARDTPASRANLKVVIILWDMPGKLPVSA